ncbi:MAG: hypothetical protein QOE14_827 [Humisphaera sp.]|nr:hypothetical protein [Humisphaera sp.]
MRNVAAILILVMTIAAGCNSKPPPDVDAAVRHRLTRYSEVWKQGDGAGVRESFVARDADEARLLDALAELAPAQAALRNAYRESLGTKEQILFGDGDPSTLVNGPRPWEAYAQAAARPQQLTYKKPIVVAHGEGEDDLAFHLRDIGGDWKLDLRPFIASDDAAQLARATRRQVRHTNDMIAAVRSGDGTRVQQLMMRQIIEVRGPQTRGVDDVTAPATTKPSRAKENPPAGRVNRP